MLPSIRFGPYLVQIPGLILLAGVWVGSWLAEREAKHLKINAATIYNLILYGSMAGIVGARLAYAARYAVAYLDDPLSLFALNYNTLALFDGLIIGLVVAYLYGKRKALALRPTLDALAPGLAAVLLSAGISNTLSGNAFGTPTDLPWAILLWDEYRHPVQIYETILALWILVLVLRRPLGQSDAGLNFLLTVALSSAARLFLEVFRGDSLIWPGGYRAPQVVSLVILLICLWLMRELRSASNRAPQLVRREIT